MKIKNVGFLKIEHHIPDLVWCATCRKWMSIEQVKNCEGTHWQSNFAICHSYKAFKRHLRKHDELPKGEPFWLVSKWYGYDIRMIKK